MKVVRSVTCRLCVLGVSHVSNTLKNKEKENANQPNLLNLCSDDSFDSAIIKFSEILLLQLRHSY